MECSNFLLLNFTKLLTKSIYLLAFFVASLVAAQQNDEFKSTKKFFDYQREMLNREFKKQFDREQTPEKKRLATQDYADFMVKLDSIQNRAYIHALIKVKNREDLSEIKAATMPELQLRNPQKELLSEQPIYPGGIENLRAHVADIFYSDSILRDQNLLKTSVLFVVERDGSISNVKAEGENFTFNRQAEIAMYLLPQKFSPAKMDGNAVRYRFRLPLSMNLD